jgi:probable HAF family extracellular repeat protein
MRFLSWLRHLNPGQAPARATRTRRAPGRKPTAARLYLEQLEHRWCPSGPSYSVTNLGTLGGAGSSYAYGINQAGQVVGWASNGTAGDAFLWTPTNPPQMIDLGTLGGSFISGDLPASEATAINNATPVQVVGEAHLANGNYHAFLWTQGGTDGVASNPPMKDLGDLGGGDSIAYAINSATPVQVVGVSTTATGQTDGFLWQNNVMTDLGPNVTPYGINDVGQMTGYNGGAFLWQNGAPPPRPISAAWEAAAALPVPSTPAGKSSVNRTPRSVTSPTASAGCPRASTVRPER